MTVMSDSLMSGTADEQIGWMSFQLDSRSKKMQMLALLQWAHVSSSCVYQMWKTRTDSTVVIFDGIVWKGSLDGVSSVVPPLPPVLWTGYMFVHMNIYFYLCWIGSPSNSNSFHLFLIFFFFFC